MSNLLFGSLKLQTLDACRLEIPDFLLQVCEPRGQEVDGPRLNTVFAAQQPKKNQFVYFVMPNEFQERLVKKEKRARQASSKFQRSCTSNVKVLKFSPNKYQTQ